MWKKYYSQLLKHVITLYNINYVEFADEIGVSDATVRQWQTGRNFPSRSVLDNLYNSLERHINCLSTPALSAQLSNYMVKEIPFTNNLITHNCNNPGELTVNALKLCYAKGKVENMFPVLQRNAYASANRTQAVVFDFDGTLTKSNTTKTTWESIWIELGYDVNECRTLHRRFDTKEITHEEWCRITTEKFIEKKLKIDLINEIANKISLIDGCEETFQQLQARNIKIYIVSGSILLIIQKVLDRLTKYIDVIKANDFKFSSDGFFEVIIGTKYDFEGKSNFISEIAENLKISTADILFIGNSYNDKFVYTSGAETVCINPKNTDPSDRNIWHHLIQDCTSLTQILRFIV